MKSFKGENDRLKMLVLFCGEEEDPQLVHAASGALGKMCAEDKDIARKIPRTTPHWQEILSCLLATATTAQESSEWAAEVQFHAILIVRCMMETDRELATKVVESSVLEVLMALSTMLRGVVTDDRMMNMKKLFVDSTLAKAQEYGLIKANC